MEEIFLVYITTSSEAEARAMGKALVEEKLAACANIIPSIISIFNWKNNLNENKESLLLLKTTKTLFSKLLKRAKELHSYELPCIVGLPIAEGLPAFLNWVAQEVKAE